ncbi:hypothetical protein B7486_16055 [cyanobacterium TDX16]|nr:hypothetical protein B7486_16055 [cyanobacterium TDX16]
MESDVVGAVLGIALRYQDKGKMREVTEVSGVENGGLEGDLASRPDRGVTLIASRQWKQAIKELGVDLPWYTRRANILVDSEGLGGLIGKRIRIGEIELAVNDETRPCELMDRLEPGLKDVLKPDCRGGVNGRIVKAGRVRVGDEVRIIGE